MLGTLALFRDEHLTTTELVLDSWFLVHALYGRSAVLQRKPLGVVVAKDRTFSELKFAPSFPDVWSDCLEPLLELALKAQSRPVRRFALWALETNHASALAVLDGPRLLPLLKSPHEEVQALGSRLLERAAGLESLPISAWLELLSINNAQALLGVCAAVREHVAPSRLSLAQCIELACSRAAPVAELGLAWPKSARCVRWLTSRCCSSCATPKRRMFVQRGSPGWQGCWFSKTRRDHFSCESCSMRVTSMCARRRWG